MVVKVDNFEMALDLSLKFDTCVLLTTLHNIYVHVECVNFCCITVCSCMEREGREGERKRERERERETM